MWGKIPTRKFKELSSGLQWHCLLLLLLPFLVSCQSSSQILLVGSQQNSQGGEPITYVGDITKFKIKESAEVSSSEFAVSAVVPMPYGKIKDAEHFYLTDERGAKVPAQFSVLNRWWAKDNSVRHLLVHLVPEVDAYKPSDKQSGVREYLLTHGKEGNPAPNHPVRVTESTTKIVVGNGLININIEKAPFRLITPAGELTSVFQTERGVVENSFNRSDIEVEIEESGPIRSVVKVSAPTLYHHNSAAGVTHGWAMRLYLQADSSLMKLDFQLQNGAMVAKSAPLFFKYHHLRLATGCKGNAQSVRAEAPTTSGILSKPLGALQGACATVMLRNFWQMFPNGLAVDSVGTIDIELFPRWSKQFHDNKFTTANLYWLDDMRVMTKEILFDFSDSRSANDRNSISKTFQFPPVAVVPAAHYAATRATLDLGGYFPKSSLNLLSQDKTRKPVYSSRYYNLSDTSYHGYGFSMDNFGLIDGSRKRDPDQGGGAPYSSAHFFATADPADYYMAQDNAMAEMNVHPQFIARYNHDKHFQSMQLSGNPYPPDSWRKFDGNKVSFLTRDYLPGTALTSKARDEKHAWLYHVLQAYYMSGNPWMRDWLHFLGEFRKTFLKKLDPYPDGSHRGLGHALGNALDAYQISGDADLLKLVGEHLEKYVAPNLVGKYKVPGKYDKKTGTFLAAPFQLGYYMRSLIKYYEESGGDPKVFEMIRAPAEWNFDLANFGYYYDVNSTTRNSSYAGSAASIVDPIIWYALKSRDKKFVGHCTTYIQASAERTNRYKAWLGQYQSRLYRYLVDSQ